MIIELISDLLLPAAASGAAIATAIMLARVFVGRGLLDAGEGSSPPEVDKPPPEEPTADPPHEEPPPPPEPSADDSGADDTDDDDAATSYTRRLERAVDRLTKQIRFSHVRRWVGRRVVDERAVGVYLTEGIIPSAGYTVRPIRSLSEIPMLAPAEHAHDDDLFFWRVARGEAVVLVPLERHNIMEPVHEDVYEEVRKAVYLLLDLSGSMFPGHNPWRQPVWKAIAQRILFRAREAAATMLLRPFAHYVLELLRAESYKEFEELSRIVANFGEAGGTNIGIALTTAIDDLAAMELDEADLIILTDGEDNSFDPYTVRASLDRANIRLHAIMLGVDNGALRKCADVFQIIEQGLRVHDPVIRHREDT